jgi:DNA mismatch repair ATPase MutS
MTENKKSQYRKLYTAYSQKVRKIKQKLNLLAITRFIVFVVGAYLGYLLIRSNLIWGFIFIAVFLGLFIYLVTVYLKRKNQLRLVNNLMRVNSREIEASRGNISNFPDGKAYKDTSHPYANDLEIFGNKSLFQYINRTSTYSGENLLVNWLLNPLKSKEKILRRQAAVTELSERLHWRQMFTAIGYKINLGEYFDTNLIIWSKEQPDVSENTFYQIIRWALPLITLLLLGLIIYGIVPVGYFIALLLVNYMLLSRLSPKINNQHQKITRQIPALKNYSELLRHLEKENFTSEDLKDYHQQLFIEKQAASQVFKKLFRISDALDNRNNLIVGIILNLIFLWDIHQVIRLEKWHKHYASYIEKWIDIIGRFDALISLANFHYNHTKYNFPQITDEYILKSKQMGHPLIPENIRVNNDFTMEKSGDAFIITGANMAGKSTFLRTIGINMVLGMTGAPVCAESFEFKIINLFTSMNITDSLSNNESYFYAEIKRLKQLIDQATKKEDLLALLDEILTGTNTRDKEKASKAFLERLINMKITSIIATHDLSLTSLEEKYPEVIHNKSFEVNLVNDDMKYDYRLRDGIAQNMNALELLKQMKLI